MSAQPMELAECVAEDEVRSRIWPSRPVWARYEIRPHYVSRALRASLADGRWLQVMVRRDDADDSGRRYTWPKTYIEIVVVDPSTDDDDDGISSLPLDAPHTRSLDRALTHLADMDEAVGFPRVKVPGPGGDDRADYLCPGWCSYGSADRHVPDSHGSEMLSVPLVDGRRLYLSLRRDGAQRDRLDPWAEAYIEVQITDTYGDDDDQPAALRIDPANGRSLGRALGHLADMLEEIVIDPSDAYCR